MQKVFRASCYKPEFEGRELPTAEEAIAFAESGTGGVVTKLVDGKTIAGWVFDQGQWHQIDILWSGRRLNVERPN